MEMFSEVQHQGNTMVYNDMPWGVRWYTYNYINNTSLLDRANASYTTLRSFSYEMEIHEMQRHMAVLFRSNCSWPQGKSRVSILSSVSEISNSLLENPGSLLPIRPPKSPCQHQNFAVATYASMQFLTIVIWKRSGKMNIRNDFRIFCFLATLWQSTVAIENPHCHLWEILGNAPLGSLMTRGQDVLELLQGINYLGFIEQKTGIQPQKNIKEHNTSITSGQNWHVCFCRFRWLPYGSMLGIGTDFSTIFNQLSLSMNR